MVDDLDRAVLLDPQLSHDDVVDATEGVTPRVHLTVPESKKQRVKLANA